MSSQRPYIRLLTREFESVIENNKNNKKELTLIVEEIGYRKKGKRALEKSLMKAQSFIERIPENKVSEPKYDKIPSKYSPIPIKPKAYKARTLDSSNLLNNDTKKITPQVKYIRKNYSPNIILRILQIKDLDVVKSGEVLTINYGNRSIVLQETVHIEIQKKVLGYKIIFDEEKFFRVSQKTLVQLIHDLENYFYSHEIQKLNEKLEKISKSGLYINQKTLEKNKSILQKVSIFIYLVQKNRYFIERNGSLKNFDVKIHEKVEKLNADFILEEKKRYKEYFQTVEKNPLTSQQAEAVIRDADACLVNAGAGTGKTSVVIGKIGYLLLKDVVKPKEILALAYGKEAANEMRERVKFLLNQDVEARTFHSLGLSIIESSVGKKVRVADWASDDRYFLSVVARHCRTIVQNDEGGKLFRQFVSEHRYPAKYLEDFNSEGQYFEYLRKIEPRTILGILVKSFEELLIADWLLLNGIKFEYEYSYSEDTASKKRRQYQPDFYLPDYDIWIEHFGVDRDGVTAPHIDPIAYAEGMQWKRDIHASNQTTLVETYSWERMEGSLLGNLEKKLRAHDVKISPMDPLAIFEIIETSKVSENLVALIKDFLVLYKEGDYSIADLDAMAGKFDDQYARVSCFIELFKMVYEEYQSFLEVRQEYDFSDLISKANELVRSGAYHSDFKRIIIDEYQDISRGRFNLLMGLLEQQEDGRIFCVGDDWQSIYGFTGSDILKTTKFLTAVPGAEIVSLDKTFRYHQVIQDFSAEFIEKNPDQLRKKIAASHTKIQRPIRVYGFTDDKTEHVAVQKSLKDIASSVPCGESWSVFLLGRYKHCKPNNLEELQAEFSSLSIDFKTIHSSKGLEADAVVILDLKMARFGFPSQVTQDPIMSMLVPSEGDYPFSEERRVFYVALTRAKHFVAIIASKVARSAFFDDLSTSSIVSLEDGSGLVTSADCPSCQTGILVNAHPNRINGYAWQCSLAKYCDGKAKYCRTCNRAPDIPGQPCSNRQCKSHKVSE